MMDTEKVSKINTLAKSLNDNHLVANIEEGVEKAKEILGFQDIIVSNAPKETTQSKPEDELKTVNELFEEENKAGNLAEEAKEDITQIKEEVKKEEISEAEEERDIEEVEKEIEKGQEQIAEIKADAEEGRLRSGFSDDEESEAEPKSAKEEE